MRKEQLRRTFTSRKEYIQARFSGSEEPANWVAELQDCRKEMSIFHFSGHANSQLLLFMQADGSPAKVEGSKVASLFEKDLAPSLKLVFLNACATKAQVRFFHQAGVAAVIATPNKVLDKDAFNFSDIFYRGLLSGLTLRQAFNDAIFPVSHVLTGGGIHRGFELDFDEISEDKWGLFATDEKAENWRLLETSPSEESSRSPVFAPPPDWKQLQKYITRNQFRRVLKILDNSVSEEDQLELDGLTGRLEGIESKYIQGIHSPSEDMTAKNQFRFALLQFVKRLKEDWE